MIVREAYTWFMYLLHSWVRVLRWLLPQNAKLFGLVTLKTIGMTYATIIKTWWPLVLLIVGLLSYTSLHPVHLLHASSLSLTMLLVWILSSFLLLFIYYLSCRPSVDRKTVGYAVGYIPHFFWFVLFIIIIMFLDETWSALLGSIDRTAWWTFIYYIPLAILYCVWFALRFPLLIIKPVFSFSALAYSKPLFLILFLYPFTTFFIMFLLDGGAKVGAVIKSLYRGFLMQLFTLPLTLAFSILVFGLYYVMHFYLFQYPLMFLCSGCSEPVITSTVAILSLLVMPIFISIWVNVYIKHVHDEFSLYCGQQC